MSLWVGNAARLELVSKMLAESKLAVDRVLAGPGPEGNKDCPNCDWNGSVNKALSEAQTRLVRQRESLVQLLDRIDVILIAGAKVDGEIKLGRETKARLLQWLEDKAKLLRTFGE